MPELPSGTVTFLFTDVEGSTQLWEWDRMAMATAVARHLALLRAAIEAHNGVLFKVVGDAVQAAFPTAPQAVAAALDAQRALLSEGWRGSRWNDTAQSPTSREKSRWQGHLGSSGGTLPLDPDFAVFP